MAVRIQLDRDSGRHDDRLMDRAPVRHLQQPLSQLGCHSMGKANRKLDLPDSMRRFGYRPFSVHL